MPWLAARRLERLSPAPPDTRWLRPDPARFAEGLAALGPVFCLWADATAGQRRRASPPAARPDAGVLARPGLIGHACAVTPDGPREWITMHDGFGVARCRLHLLPDTDYLAWDALVAGAVAHPAPDVMPRLRARHGRRLRFEVQPVGPWRLVCARGAGEGCALSRRAARELALAEGVALLG